MVVCAECGRENAANARFCSNCGAALAVTSPERGREERKVITVLFADLVGFTSTAEQLDPEDVRATLTPYYARLRQELVRHGGTVEKFIGDAVMAVFGAPIAHEDDPERAVRSAFAIQDAIADGPHQVRIAITTGEALVSLDARSNEGEGMVAGDVVNTAARLQTAAPVNGVLVDETTQRATRQAIEYREAESIVAKGKAEPVPVWEAVAARSRFGVDLVQTGAELVGRGRELHFLTDALARVRAERAPQLVTLVGVPGIGKSRLVYELSRTVDADPDLVGWRQGRSLPYGDGITYWALSEMAKAQAGILETDTPAEAERKLVASVTDLVSDGADRVLESLRPLVGLGSEAAPRDDQPAERFAAWREYFEALADRRPTVLVFEDLHWADEALLDFVDHLVDWATGVPLLVVCTARPELLERRPGWGGGKSNALTLTISPLSDDDTARLLTSLLDRRMMPAEQQASLLLRAGGNPLYAEQFARLHQECADEARVGVPENVQGIIAARLDALPAEEKQLLQDAAVLGKVFWMGAVCAIGGRGRTSTERLLHALERKEFVRRQRSSSVGGEEEYAFRHLLVRDVAYGQIPRTPRAQQHERAAGWLESLGRREENAEMLALHYLEALRLLRASGRGVPPGLTEKARLAARDAAARTLALSAYSNARRWHEAALELAPPGDPLRPGLLLGYARSRYDDVTLDDAVLEEATEGLLAAGDVESAAHAQMLLGSTWWVRADRDVAFLHMDRALELVEDRPPSSDKAFVLQKLARFAVLSEDFDRAIALGSESLRLAELLGLDDYRARNLNTLGMARVHGGDQRGFDDLEQALALAHEVRSPEEAIVAGNLAWVWADAGDLRRAVGLHQQSVQIAARRGLEASIRWYRAEHVYYCYWQGRWDEAVAGADDFIREVEAGASHYMETYCRYLRGAIRLARGDRTAALADAARASEVARRGKDPQVLHPALAFEARARAACGDRDGANAIADELLEVWAETGVRAQSEAVDGAWAFAALGRADELHEALDRARLQTPWHEAGRLVARGDLASAAEVYAQIGTVPDEAYARLRAAASLVAEGRRADADKQLRMALPVFAGLGATALTAEAESLLAASA
jgi:class 3 adenylate cyclase/tetratricopeptide (TPR) repeat protein